MGLRPFSRHHHLLWITVLVLLASGTLLLAACGSTTTSSGTSTPTATTAQQTPTPTPTTASGGSNTVDIVENGGQFAFSPAALTVAKGTTVTWINMTGASHTITSDNNAFTGSNELSQNQTFKITFTTAGTFTYHCSIHTYMTATIVVTA